MNIKAYNTGTIELMPYPEHGEFCIVGVFAIDAQARTIHYRLQEPRKTKRLSGFFPELERKLFTRTLKSVHEEWLRLADMVNKGDHTEEFRELTKVDGADIFKAIVQPREGMIRHKERGTILSKDINAWLDEAFTKMVLRIDLDSIYPEETKFTNHVSSLLKEWNVAGAWKAGRVGQEDYHTTFPFTYTPQGAERVERAIKPLFLGQDSATKILDHGDVWLQKVRRLKHFNLAPELLIFPVQRPVESDDIRQKHADLVIEDLKQAGVEVIEQNNIAHLQHYVQIEATENAPLFTQPQAY
ncbi:DUF3037 domain-containing protein [Rubritalea tangerina]|uniref:DUF3037 domain-containing protein n=2 Tax=Rubritalea tangerina TaxID=430798 RepID=A0ABW4Z8R6_9BACT